MLKIRINISNDCLSVTLIITDYSDEDTDLPEGYTSEHSLEYYHQSSSVRLFLQYDIIRHVSIKTQRLICKKNHHVYYIGA